MALLSPTSGTIDWQGGKGDDDLGVVFQEPTLLLWVRAKDNIWLPFSLREKSCKNVNGKIMQGLKLEGLEDFQNAFPREVSVGMKMRVSIVRALVTRSRLLLMEEPFAA